MDMMTQKTPLMRDVMPKLLIDFLGCRISDWKYSVVITLGGDSSCPLFISILDNVCRLKKLPNKIISGVIRLINQSESAE